MEIFVYIVTATGAATLCHFFLRLLDFIDKPDKKIAPPSKSAGTPLKMRNGGCGQCPQ